jgi:hypothetical protein
MQIRSTCSSSADEYVAQAIKSATKMYHDIENMETTHHKFDIPRPAVFKDLVLPTVTVILRTHDEEDATVSSLGEQLTDLIDVHPAIMRYLRIDFQLEAVPKLPIHSEHMREAVSTACQAINVYMNSAPGLPDHATIAAKDNATDASPIRLFHVTRFHISWPDSYHQTWMNYQIWYLGELRRRNVELQGNWQPGQWEYLRVQNGRESVKVSWGMEDGV